MWLRMRIPSREWSLRCEQRSRAIDFSSIMRRACRMPRRLSEMAITTRSRDRRLPGADDLPLNPKLFDCGRLVPDSPPAIHVQAGYPVSTAAPAIISTNHLRSNSCRCACAGHLASHSGIFGPTRRAAMASSTKQAAMQGRSWKPRAGPCPATVLRAGRPRRERMSQQAGSNLAAGDGYGAPDRCADR